MKIELQMEELEQIEAQRTRAIKALKEMDRAIAEMHDCLIRAAIKINLPSAEKSTDGN